MLESYWMSHIEYLRSILLSLHFILWRQILLKWISFMKNVTIKPTSICRKTENKAFASSKLRLWKHLIEFANYFNDTCSKACLVHRTLFLSILFTNKLASGLNSTEKNFGERTLFICNFLTADLQTLEGRFKKARNFKQFINLTKHFFIFPFSVFEALKFICNSALSGRWEHFMINFLAVLPL